jgi:hypothetical protein
VHPGLNLALLLLPVIVVPAYAAALRRQVEHMDDPEAAELAGAAVGSN